MHINMNEMADRKASIDLSNLNNPTFEPEFATRFCQKFAVQVEEFDAQFEQGVSKKDRKAVSDIVHKIMSSLMFIELDEFCELISQYKALDMDNEVAVQDLISEVHEYCEALLESLKAFSPDSVK